MLTLHRAERSSALVDALADLLRTPLPDPFAPEVVAVPAGVSVYREREVSALAPLAGVLTATQVERVYDVARNAEAWLEA